MQVQPQSTLRFIYPFAFDAGQLDARTAQIDAAEWEGLGRPWQRHELPDEDLLPVVARYLNGRDSELPCASMWRLDGNALQSPQGLGGGAKKPVCRWKLTQRNTELPFRICSLIIVLYPAGIGCVIVEANPESNDAEIWFDFVNAFRFLAGSRAPEVSAVREGQDGTTASFLPSCARSGTSFMDVIAGLLDDAKTDSDAGTDWWSNVFIRGQALPFCSVFLEGAPRAEDPEAVYRLRNLFSSRQQVRLAASDRDLTHESLLPYADRQWFILSLDGAAFIGFDCPDTPFYRDTLPAHLSRQYLSLYLLALHQRFRLTLFSEEVARHWAADPTRESMRAFERLDKAILSFRAQGMFTQVGQRHHLHSFYRKGHEVFEITRHYDEVSCEVQDMHDHMLISQTRHLERRINQLAIMLGVPGLVMSFLGINLIAITANEDGMTWWAAMLTTVVVSTILGFFGLKLLDNR